MARTRLRFNQYKSNIKLNGEGRRGFKKEKLIQHFLLLSHNGTDEDITEIWKHKLLFPMAAAD